MKKIFNTLFLCFVFYPSAVKSLSSVESNRRYLTSIKYVQPEDLNYEDSMNTEEDSFGVDREFTSIKDDDFQDSDEIPDSVRFDFGDESERFEEPNLSWYQSAGRSLSDGISRFSAWGRKQLTRAADSVLKAKNAVSRAGKKIANRFFKKSIKKRLENNDLSRKEAQDIENLSKKSRKEQIDADEVERLDDSDELDDSDFEDDL